MQKTNSLQKVAKKIFFYLVLVAIILGSVEGLSFTYFHFFHDRFTFSNAKDYVLDEDTITKIKDYFDADLGWKWPNYDTPYGERFRPNEYNDPLISTFGDSHTRCDEVNDDQTWQHYLSNTINKDVYNFGTGGFGTDQAYLQYKKVYPEVKTQIVTLGLISENLNRIVSVYWPFLYPNKGIYFTKPRFVLENNDLKLIKNPIQNENDLSKLGDKKFIENIKNDYWSNNKFPNLSFPYTAIFFNSAFQDELINGKYNDSRNRTIDLWKNQEIVSLMFKIFDNFVADAKKNGATPIIMLLPEKFEVNMYKNGEKIISRDKILEYCNSKNYLCFDGIKPMADTATNQSDIDSYFSYHATATGNEVIAKNFYEYLKEKELVK